MESKLHLLDSFPVHGSDGADYKVCAYEHLVRDPSVTSTEQWTSTGVSEYRLDSGDRIDVSADGAMTLARSGVRLQR